ncbi:MAG: aminotransferase class III-fold pyridoxal phosphate-dependent enzyme [Chloroflexota bacterium]|nr:aminotransferase class III-fold pyridoxal phosphate-dependent enzyme [Chloroflexota bacterium]
MTTAQPSETDSATAHFDAAREVLPAGISGAARENAALGQAMLAASGEGPYIIAPDGRRYLDYFSGFGSVILGYGHAGVRAAIEQALDMGIIHGPETVYQERLARRLVDLVPSAEMVRFANSGSEATMAAIRLARAHTGRTKILKFEGHFHGIHEHVLYNTHPEPRTVTPGEILATSADSAGIPSAFADAVVVAPWNDLPALSRAFESHGSDIAAVIMEPINYNAGALLADGDYLRAVREITRDQGSVLIFDEVLSGFRTGTDCAQGFYDVTPDVTLLGKAVANGVPLAVIAGRREVMSGLAPLGQSAHSGTYSGHIFGVLAALATLDALESPGVYDGETGLMAMSDRFYGGLREIFEHRDIRCRVQGVGPRFALYFGLDPEIEPRAYQDIAGHDSETLKRFARACYARGVYFHVYDVVVGHHGFGAAHDAEVIDETLDRIDAACVDLSAD